MEASAAMTTLHRHQIARVSAAGWRSVCNRDWDATARACLNHWAAQGLPLVVTRRPCGVDESSDDIALGLPAPGRWDRRRIALQIPLREVLYFDEFPNVAAVACLLPDAAQGPWRRLCVSLRALGAAAHVYGSYGWQQISGLDHVRGSSDIDVWVAVSSAHQADAVASLMQAFACPELRLDGELVFDGRTAAAWREWLAWRAGSTKALLVKEIDGAALVRSIDPVGTLDRLRVPS